MRTNVGPSLVGVLLCGGLALGAGCSEAHEQPTDAGDLPDAGEPWVSTGGYCNPWQHPVVFLEGPSNDCIALFYTWRNTVRRLDGTGGRLNPVWLPDRGDMSGVMGVDRYPGDNDAERVRAIGWSARSCADLEDAVTREDPLLDAYVWATSAIGVFDAAQFPGSDWDDSQWASLEIHAEFPDETTAPPSASLGALYAMAVLGSDPCRGLDPETRARREASVDERLGEEHGGP